MNIYSFPAIVAFVVNFTVAFAVFFGNTRSSANRWISAFVFGLAAWNLSEIFILASGSQQGATLAAQILYRVIFITPAAYVIAAYHFPAVESGPSRGALFILAVFLVPVVFLVSSFPHFHIMLIPLSDSGAVYHYRINLHPDFQSISLLSTFFGYLFWGSIVTIRRMSDLRTTTQKRRARLFLGGGTVFLLSWMLLFIVGTAIENVLVFYAASTILSIVVSGFFAVAVLGGRMFNTPATIRSSLAYSIASSIILTVYFLSVEAVTQGLLNYLRIGSFAANAMFVLGMVLLIRPLELRINGTLDRLLNRDVRRYRHDLVSFSRDISNYLPAQELFQRVELFLLRQFQIQHVLVLIRDERSNDPSGRQQFSEWKALPDSLRLKEECDLVHRLRETRKAVELYDIDRDCDPTLRSRLDAQNIRILVPLLVEDNLIGILALGLKKTGRGLTAEMIDALMIFASEVATAYHRNSTIERMREKERQEFRTQHLASLAQLTAGVAHEIRNPLGIISTSAQTLLKRKLPQKEEEELKQFIVIEADRLNTILTDFLSLAKQRTPKIEQVSLDELLGRLQKAIAPSAGDIDISVSTPAVASSVFTDGELLYQLLFNLGINAVDAVKERCKSDAAFLNSSGRISVGTSVEDGRLSISVSDNGTGIREEHLQKIFEPFYTTKENGTGLGLSICHTIAETMGGHLRVSSRKGETIFTFTCEIEKEQG